MCITKGCAKTPTDIQKDICISVGLCMQTIHVLLPVLSGYSGTFL